MSRHKKPTKILELSGAFKKNPNRVRANEPQPERLIGECPNHLSDEHKVIWNEIVDKCADGVLTCQDELALEIVVKGVHQMRHGDISGAEMDRLFKQIGKFGMNPSERSNVMVKSPEKESKFKNSK